MCNCVRTWFVLNHAPLEQEPHVLSVLWTLNMFREMFFKVEDRRTSLSSIQFYLYNAKSQSPECDWPTLSKHLVKETLSASWETQKPRPIPT